jgi:hypothetical protein
MHGTGRGNADADHLLIIDIVATNTVEQSRVERLQNKQDMFDDVFARDALIADIRHAAK